MLTGIIERNPIKTAIALGLCAGAVALALGHYAVTQINYGIVKNFLDLPQTEELNLDKWIPIYPDLIVNEPSHWAYKTVTLVKPTDACRRVINFITHISYPRENFLSLLSYLDYSKDVHLTDTTVYSWNSCNSMDTTLAKEYLKKWLGKPSLASSDFMIRQVENATFQSI